MNTRRTDLAQQVIITTFKVVKLTQNRKARIVAGLKRSWQEGGTHRTLQKLRAQNNPDSARKRALYNARGQELFIASNNNLKFRIIRSINGRTDQFDIEEICGLEYKHILTCSGPKIFSKLEEMFAAAKNSRNFA